MGGGPEAEQLGQRGTVGADTGGGAEPGDGFLAPEAADVELGQAAARPGDGRVEPGQRLVGGDGHQGMEDTQVSKADSPTIVNITSNARISVCAMKGANAVE